MAPAARLAMAADTTESDSSATSEEVSSGDVKVVARPPRPPSAGRRGPRNVRLPMPPHRGDVEDVEDASAETPRANRPDADHVADLGLSSSTLLADDEASPGVAFDPEHDDEPEDTTVGAVSQDLLALSAGEENTRAFSVPTELIELAKRERAERRLAGADAPSPRDLSAFPAANDEAAPPVQCSAVDSLPVSDAPEPSSSPGALSAAGANPAAQLGPSAVETPRVASLAPVVDTAASAARAAAPVSSLASFRTPWRLRAFLASVMVVLGYFATRFLLTR